MKCAWNALLMILPRGIQQEVNRIGKENLQELRLRLGKRPALILNSGIKYLPEPIRREDIDFVISAASKYSPWTAATISQGYITAPGGHRIGICGECVIQNEKMTGIKNPCSLCIRVARDFPGISTGIPIKNSVLILGPPGVGKTTLLRDLIRRHGNDSIGSIAVVDERGELFPLESGFDTGASTDILTGCSKSEGIEVALRTMGPSWIAVDEITSEKDCKALLNALWCGVKLLATVHAIDRNDLFFRPLYRPLAESGFWEELIILQQDKSWRRERMGR